MEKAKLDVLVVLFCYSGNGGYAAVIPDIAVWFAKRYMEMSNDERIGRVGVIRAGDVPLTAERNRVVKKAKDEGFDVIVMLDSDNIPDLYLGHVQSAVPFWETSFDFLYERAVRNLPTVVCAPYCGPPPHPVNGGCENVYVFYFESFETADGKPDLNSQFKIEAYSREAAATMTGIKPVAAGPTGVIMYSTDAFDLMPIREQNDEEVLTDFREGKITETRALQLLRMRSWFYYEYTDQYETGKASTEDVVNLREIQMAGTDKHGEPIVFCNWDAWAGHAKQKIVGKPAPLRVEQISPIFAEAVLKNRSVRDELVELDLEPLDDECGIEFAEKDEPLVGWDVDTGEQKYIYPSELKKNVLGARSTTPDGKRVMCVQSLDLRQLTPGCILAWHDEAGFGVRLASGDDDPVGVVDPDLTDQIKYGDVFWMTEGMDSPIPSGHGPPEYDEHPPMQSLAEMKEMWGDGFEKALDISKEELDERSKADPAVPAMRLGKVFPNPSVDENTCELLRALVGKAGFNARRAIVIGDKTGEICHAVHWDEMCATYAMDVGPNFSENGARLLDADTENQVNPGARAKELDPQGLDAVVLKPSVEVAATATAWDRHVRPGGALIIMDEDDSRDFSHILDSDAYQYRQVEGTGIHAFIKKHASA